MLKIDKNIDRIQELCKRHNVHELYLFGSATSERFSEKSDIDFLVSFNKIDLAQYFNNYIDLKEKLKLLFKRDVDLVEKQTLKNPILIKSINRSKELSYG